MATETKTVDVKIPIWIKALPLAGSIGGAFLAHHRKSKVGGWIGWILLGGLVGTVISIPLTAGRAFKAFGGEAMKDLKNDLQGAAAGNIDEQIIFTVNATPTMKGFSSSIRNILNHLSEKEKVAFLFYIKTLSELQSASTIGRRTPDQETAYQHGIAKLQSDMSSKFDKQTILNLTNYGLLN